MSSSTPSLRARIYQPPLAKHRETVQSWVYLVKKAYPIWHRTTFSSSTITCLDKIIFHPIMPLNITRPKTKIPAFPVKAGEKPMVSSFSS